MLNAGGMTPIEGGMAPSVCFLSPSGDTDADVDALMPEQQLLTGGSTSLLLLLLPKSGASTCTGAALSRLVAPLTPLEDPPPQQLPDVPEFEVVTLLIETPVCPFIVAFV